VNEAGVIAPDEPMPNCHRGGPATEAEFQARLACWIHARQRCTTHQFQPGADPRASQFRRDCRSGIPVDGDGASVSEFKEGSCFQMKFTAHSTTDGQFELLECTVVLDSSRAGGTNDQRRQTRVAVSQAAGLKWRPSGRAVV
jgi:hypothetical protein